VKLTATQLTHRLEDSVSEQEAPLSRNSGGTTQAGKSELRELQPGPSEIFSYKIHFGFPKKDHSQVNRKASEKTRKNRKRYPLSRGKVIEKSGSKRKEKKCRKAGEKELVNLLMASRIRP
jgi:hypothetical protein